MTMTLNDWTTDVSGKVIGSGQCVGLVQDYLTRCLGGGFLATEGGAHPGYAIAAWDGFADNGLSQWFSQAPANATALPGWVPVWKFGILTAPFTPLSHIAVALKDMGAGIQCMTQNPGPAHTMIIPKAGLAGYLVPNGGNTGLNINLASDTTGSAGSSNPVSASFDLISSVNKVSAYFANADNWKRIGIMALGIILLIIVLIIMFGESALNTVKELP